MPCAIMEAVIDGRLAEGRCCFYDTVTMWAFGPVFISEEKAEAFWEYLGGDPRKFSSSELEDKWAAFCKTEPR